MSVYHSIVFSYFRNDEKYNLSTGFKNKLEGFPGVGQLFSPHNNAFFEYVVMMEKISPNGTYEQLVDETNPINYQTMQIARAWGTRDEKGVNLGCDKGW
ncbi:MAG: hypothetical protein K9I74_01315 [Bacteroidales bacterium]|nr:hypothetical protein [Bacteroidales bacterium]